MRADSVEPLMEGCPLHDAPWTIFHRIAARGPFDDDRS